MARRRALPSFKLSRPTIFTTDARKTDARKGPPLENSANMDEVFLSYDDYTVAWICPLEVEQIAAMEMLDKEHERLPQPQHDHIAYTLGSI